MSVRGKTLVDFPDVFSQLDLVANGLTSEQGQMVKAGYRKKYIWSHIASNGQIHTWRTNVYDVVKGTRCGTEPCRKEKLTKTCQTKYNVDHFAKAKGFNEKRMATNKKKLGVEHPTQSAAVKEKTRINTLARLGVEHVTQHESFKEKIKATNLAKFGFENAMQNPEVQA